MRMLLLMCLLYFSVLLDVLHNVYKLLVGKYKLEEDGYGAFCLL